MPVWSGPLIFVRLLLEVQYAHLGYWTRPVCSSMIAQNADIMLAL
jgi:hypothetical protein